MLHLNLSDLFRRASLSGGTARHPTKSKVASVDGMGLTGRLTGHLWTVSGLLLRRPRHLCCHR
jgi:hypothetical protein